MKRSGTCNYHLSWLTIMPKRDENKRTSCQSVSVPMDLCHCFHLARFNWRIEVNLKFLLEIWHTKVFWFPRCFSKPISCVVCTYLWKCVVCCFVMMSSSGAKFVLLLSLHNNSEAERERCPDYWSISLHRHWRDSPGLPAQTGDEGDMMLWY